MLLAIICIALSCNLVHSRSYFKYQDDLLPEVSNLVLQKGKPLQLTKVNIRGLRGTLYSDAFSELTHLTELEISDHQLSEIEDGAFCSAPNVKRLEINSPNNGSWLLLSHEMFGNCGHLERLDLIGGRNKLETYLHVLQNTPNLKTLLFENVNVKHFGLGKTFLKNLESLTELRIYSCDIDDIDPDSFAALRNVEKIVIIYSKIRYIPEGLFKNTPRLKYLSLRHNEIRGLTWDEFEGLTSLEFLQLDFNRISSFDAEKISKHMPNLKYFDFQHNLLNNSSEETLANELRTKLCHLKYSS